MRADVHMYVKFNFERIKKNAFACNTLNASCAFHIHLHIYGMGTNKVRKELEKSEVKTKLNSQDT